MHSIRFWCFEAVEIAANLVALSALLAAIGLAAGYVEAGTMGPV